MDTVNIALVGNPNVGKSTLFNALTGLRQHTGNWPGKTVEAAYGTYSYRGKEYRLTDLPGLYSLRASSEEERLAAEYITGSEVDCTVVVCDATCLARSLILALQVTGLSRKMVICLNLCDEAAQRGIITDVAVLRQHFNIPVIETSAGKHEGLEQFRRTLRDVCDDFLPAIPAVRYVIGEEHDAIETAKEAKRIAKIVQREEEGEKPWRKKLDRLLLSRFLGYPMVFALLLVVLWLTIWGANYPGIALEWLFSYVKAALSWLLQSIPPGLRSFLMDGVFETTVRVVTVMLPPMAIFFPLFTILEDLGVLPRLAFLLDRPFERCGACGKQALTSCMSLGCNAVGVTGCRIIDSPRERLIAILTASFLPCNGRFPTLILLAAILFPGRDIVSAFLVALALVFAILMTMGISWVLSRTLLKGSASGFVMELPPYRKPRVGEVVVRSLLDRTLFVLGRAILVAAPAGAIIWIASHVQIGEDSLLTLASNALEPLGAAIGLSGPILLAFMLGFPANELVIPVLVMLLTGAQTLGGNAGITEILLNNSLTGISAVCMMVFCLFHWPCGTTLLTIHKETKSLPWTLCAFALPTLVGMLLCFLLNLIA
ncbi:MAG: ferrous iron transporter B [Ruminococcaceae bacterium]|nr:ferrous iron transporter B [Oscillospiraceae bacterium]